MDIINMPAGMELDKSVADAIKAPKLDFFGPLMPCPYSTTLGWWTETMLHWCSHRGKFQLVCNSGERSWSVSLESWHVVGETLPLAMARLVTLVSREWRDFSKEISP